MQSVFVLFGLLGCGLLWNTAGSAKIPVGNEDYRETTVTYNNQPSYSEGLPQNLGPQAPLPTSYQNVFLANSVGSSTGPSYLPPIDHSSQYSGPDYLPPLVSTTGPTIHLQQQQQQQNHPQQNIHSHISQVAPEPRLQGAQSVSQYQFHGPEYLPPFKGGEQQQQQQRQQQQQQHQQQSFVHEGQQSQQKASIQQQQYQDQGIIHQRGHQQQVIAHRGRSQQHELQQQNQQQQQQQLSETTSYKSSPDYLPPLSGSTEDRRLQHVTPSTTFRRPDYLPPLANAVGGEEQSKDSEHLSLANNFAQVESRSSEQRLKHTRQQQQQHDQNISTTLGFIPLPTGYEFNKPDEADAKAAFLQLHSLQLEQQKLMEQQKQQEQQNPEQQLQLEKRRLISHQAEHQQQQRPQLKVIQDSYNNNHYKNNNNVFKGATNSGYQTSFQGSSQSAFLGQQQQPTEQYSPLQKDPEYLPPMETSASSSQQQQPPHQQDLRSLTGAMTAGQLQAQYNDGYLSAAPVHAEYSRPSAANIAPPQVAPVHRERTPTTGPQQYAPAMSYRANSVPQTHTSYTLKSSAILTQGDGREDLNNGNQYQTQQQHQHVAVVTHGDTGKIRTVQILKSKELKKTLKVLETADAAGVTTLNIIGPSNEDPMGAHQVVRVVSASDNDHGYDQQTVKIFNDHKAVTFDGLRTPSVAVRGAVNNEYLPPTNCGGSNRHQRF